MAYDVIIVGAGIVGCACARECAIAGLRVAIIEGDIPGGGATAAGMGHIVVMDDSPAQLALTRYARSIWQELQPEFPTAVEYEGRGTLWVAGSQEELDEVHAKKATYSSADIHSLVLDGAQLAEAEPNLRPGLAGGLLVPEDAVVYPPAAAGFFLRQAESLGAVLWRGQPVVNVGRGTVRLRDGTELHCGNVVAATGADSSLLPWLPIQKRKGHLLITDRYPGLVHHQLLELGYLKSAHKVRTDSVAFNIQPRRTGQLLIGSSRQYGSNDLAIDRAILRKMLERACRYMPAIAQISGIRTWTGFRPATSDNLPLIGPTEKTTLLLAAGFEGLGITNAPAAARMIVDHLLHRKPAISPEPYLPTRSSLAGYAHV